MFRFTIRDVLWLTVVAALGCLLLVQRQHYINHTARLGDQIEELKKLAQQPRSVTVGQVKHDLPPRMRRAIVEFPMDGGVSVRFEPISD